MQDIIQLIDEDLDNVAGGDFNISNVDIDQDIVQFQFGYRSWQSQEAANVASVSVDQQNN